MQNASTKALTLSELSGYLTTQRIHSPVVLIRQWSVDTVAEVKACVIRWQAGDTSGDVPDVLLALDEGSEMVARWRERYKSDPEVKPTKPTQKQLF